MNCPHCEIDINKHEATRCLDAWIAHEILGQSVELVDTGWSEFDDPDWIVEGEVSIGIPGGVGPLYVNKYSTDIQVAWRVLVRLQEQDWEYSVSPDHVMLCHKEWIANSVAQSRPVITAKGDVPLAICRAAIKAKGREDDDS